MPLTRSADFSRRFAATGFAAATMLWLLLLVVSPYLVSQQQPGTTLFSAGGLVYMAGRLVCHQRADRSFHAWGVQLPVCGRCVGLYAGAVLGSLIVAGRGRQSGRQERAATRSPADQMRTWRTRLAVAAVPTALSVGLEVGGIWAQSPPVRFAAAIPLGFTVAWFVAAHAAEAVAAMRAQA